MASIYLAPYSITFHKHGDRSNLDFDSLFQKPTFISIANSFLKRFTSRFEEDSEKAGLFRVTSLEVSSHTLHAIIESGEYGIESKFYDLNGNHQYDRKQNHAEIMPFYLMIYAPPKSNISFLIMQRFGQYGISGAVTGRLKEFLKSEKPGYIYEIAPIVSSKILQKIVRTGDIQKVTFKKYSIPSDIANFMNSKAREDSYMEMSFVAKRNKSINLGEQLNKVFFGNRGENALLKIKNFDYDEAKILIDYPGGKRTIHLGDNKFRAHYDVTADVAMASGGHPTFKSIKKVAMDIVNDLQKMV